MAERKPQTPDPEAIGYCAVKMIRETICMGLFWKAASNI